MPTQPQDPRGLPRLLSQKAAAEGNPLAWFEQFYRLALSKGYPIPWADMKPNPNLVEMYDRIPLSLSSTDLLVVGCGFGDDAEWLARKGHKVSAFDISSSAISECHKRFPDSPVHYLEANLFDPPPHWRNYFNVVVESYTVQVLEGSLRRKALLGISELVAPEGLLILISRGRSDFESAGALPWPLTRSEIEVIVTLGFQELFFDDYLDRTEENPTRRFRACYRKSKV
jgi:SAM-dependent methyltransferase